MNNQGWIKLDRKILDCWIWVEPEPFSKRDAWIDLLLLANHKDAKTTFDGKLITVKRGQRLTSVRSLGERWMWGKTKVLNFLRLLESDKMIVRQADSRKTLITIVNYDKFQGSDIDSETLTRQSQDSHETVTGQSPSTNKNDKNDKNEKNNNKIRAREEEPEAPVELIPLSDGSGWRPTMSEYEEYGRLFPDVDIDAEFRSMRAWCLANSKKTRNGIRRFVNSWLTRAQDSPKKKLKKGGTQSVDDYMLAVIRGEAI